MTLINNKSPMNALKNTPYLLCPQCKGRVRADAASHGGVAKCPVCQEAGLLAMHHFGMGGRLGKGVAFCALAAATWFAYPQIKANLPSPAGNAVAVDEPARATQAGADETIAARPVAVVIPAMQEEQLSSSILPGHMDAVADFHEVARLHRMVSVSAASMEDLRKSFVAAIGNSKLDGMFEPALVKTGGATNTRSIEAAMSLAADYQAECEQVARDLRMAISEADVSEGARERGLGFLRTMVLHEQSLWQDVMLTFNDGLRAAPAAALAMEAQGSKADRAAAAKKSAALEAIDKRWDLARKDLEKPAALPPMPSPTGIAVQEPTRLRGSK